MTIFAIYLPSNMLNFLRSILYLLRNVHVELGFDLHFEQIPSEASYDVLFQRYRHLSCKSSGGPSICHFRWSRRCPRPFAPSGLRMRAENTANMADPECNIVKIAWTTTDCGLEIRDVRSIG